MNKFSPAQLQTVNRMRREGLIIHTLIDDGDEENPFSCELSDRDYSNTYKLNERTFRALAHKEALVVVKDWQPSTTIHITDFALKAMPQSPQAVRREHKPSGDSPAVQTSGTPGSIVE